MGVKISDLPDSGAISDADLIELVQSGASRKGTFARIKDWIAGDFARLTGADFIGPITVPGGAIGTQVPRANEIGNLAVAQRADLFRRGNVLGTVSQSGGIPSGAMIENGTNANGAYVRFADGTQICWRTAAAGTTSSAAGSLFMSPTNASGNWAAAFVSAPAATAITSGSSGAQCWCGDLATTTSGFSGLRIFSVINTASANVQIIAIGRWF